MDPQSFKALVDKKEALETLLSTFDARLLFFGALVLIGIAGETWYGVRTWFNSRNLRTLQKQVDAERERQSEEEIARLNKETADARLELSKIDPLNLPIKTIHVDVFCMIRGDFSESKLDEMMHFRLEGKNGTMLEVNCTKADVHLSFVGGPNGLVMTLAFDWPSIGFSSIMPLAFDWRGGISPSTRQLDDELVRASISSRILNKPGEIDPGTCRMTINGAILRGFDLSKVTVPDGLIAPVNVNGKPMGAAFGKIICTPVSPAVTPALLPSPAKAP